MDNEHLNDDMEDVEPVINAEAEFFNTLETLDVDKIMELWSDDDRVSIVFPGIDMAMGPISVRLAWSDIATHTSSLKADLEPFSYMRHGDLAWSFLAGRIISTHRDETLSIEVYITNFWRREPNA